MQIDQLVDTLASDLRPVRRRTTAGDALILGVICATELAAYLVLGKARPDIAAAVGEASFWWKLISLGLLAAIGSVVTIASFDPAASPRRGLSAMAATAALCLAAGWGIDAARDGWPNLAVRLDWRDGLDCVSQMALLSLPAVVGLGVLMRRGAPSDPARTALTAGIAAAAWGAFVFVFACPYDDPVYIAVWYGVGCGLVATLSRAILPLLTRW